jgi:hypothetical protein
LFNNSHERFGDGIDIGGEVIQVTRCCGNNC